MGTARGRGTVNDQKHGPAIVRSVGGDEAVHRAAYWGARPDPKLPAQRTSQSAQANLPTAPQGS